MCAMVTMMQGMSTCVVKGKDRKRHEVAYLHEGYYIFDGYVTFSSTVRHKACDIITTGSSVQCKACSKYQAVLRPIYHNYIKGLHQPLKSKANVRYMNTPKRSQHLRSLRRTIRNAKRRVKLMTQKLEEVTLKEGITQPDEALESDMMQVLSNHQNEIDTLNSSDFKRIFWEQQVCMYTSY